MRTKKLAQKHGLDAKVVDFADADMAVLSKAKNLMVFASTWGEGDPPAPRRRLLHRADGRRRPAHRGRALCRARAGRHGVCAVLRHRQGDRRAPRGAGRQARLRPRRSRSRLCQAGGRVDREGPHRAGAGRAPPAPPRSCMSTSRAARMQPTTTTSRNSPPRTRSPARSPRWSTSTARGSTRETWHVEIAAEAPGFSYLPGDAIGIVPENDPDLAAGAGRGRRPRCGRRRRAEAARALRRDDAVARRSSKPTPSSRGARMSRTSPSRRRSPSSPRTASSSTCSSAIPRSSPPISCSACCVRCRAGSTPSPRVPRRTRARRICWSAPCAGSHTARSATASPRPTSPTAARSAIRRASTSSRTAISACPRTATARSS